MKTFTIDIAVAMILALLAYWLLPWWGLGVAGLIFPLIRYRGSAKPTLTAAFLAGFICWIAFAGYMNQLNEGIIAARIGSLFGGLSPAMMVIVTAFLGGMTYLLGSWAGLTSIDAVKSISRK